MCKRPDMLQALSLGATGLPTGRKQPGLATNSESWSQQQISKYRERAAEERWERARARKSDFLVRESTNIAEQFVVTGMAHNGPHGQDRESVCVCVCVCVCA